MKRKKLAKYTIVLAISALIIIPLAALSTGQKMPNPPPELKEALMSVDWNEHHHYEFFGWLLETLSDAYPHYATTYSIGHSWRERQIWCIEMTSPGGMGGFRYYPKHRKVEVAVISNIHGGEQESAESAAYVAWWLLTNYKSNSRARFILDNFVVYVVPLLNPDGFEQSFIYNCRTNFRPLDKNGDGICCNDPYVDTNGDGIIANVYTGPVPEEGVGYTTTQRPSGLTSLGREGLDFDHDGILSNDVKESGIDLNRNFDYMWNCYDIDVTPHIGNPTRTGGPDAASEPEVQAIQDFLASKNIKALSTLHTGEQSVLWPWCYNPEPPADPDGSFMAETAHAMAEALSTTTGRDYYDMQSYWDYPTTAELIDWSYGRLGIYSYTVELYAYGTRPYHWGNTNRPPYEYVYMGTLTLDDGSTIENVWFRNRPPGSYLPEGDQEIICAGNLEASIVMFMSVAPTHTVP